MFLKELDSCFSVARSTGNRRNDRLYSGLRIAEKRKDCQTENTGIAGSLSVRRGGSLPARIDGGIPFKKEAATGRNAVGAHRRLLRSKDAHLEVLLGIFLHVLDQAIQFLDCCPYVIGQVLVRNELSRDSIRLVESFNRRGEFA